MQFMAKRHMKNVTIPLLIILSIGIAFGPLSESYAQMTTQSQEKIPEKAIKQVESLDNFGIKVANFVKMAAMEFKEQREETIDAIKECRENVRNAAPSEREQLRQECRTNLDEIKDSYRDIRDTFRETFLEFRDEMKILVQDARGEDVEDSEKQDAVDRIDEKTKDKMNSIDGDSNNEKRMNVEKLHEKIKKMETRD